MTFVSKGQDRSTRLVVGLCHVLFSDARMQWPREKQHVAKGATCSNSLGAMLHVGHRELPPSRQLPVHELLDGALLHRTAALFFIAQAAIVRQYELTRHRILFGSVNFSGELELWEASFESFRNRRARKEKHAFDFIHASETMVTMQCHQVSCMDNARKLHAPMHLALLSSGEA